MGYGRLRFAGGFHLAHRVAWTLTFGPIPDGRKVLHRCDTPLCCNPQHLFLGDDALNASDREAKGRGHHPRGTEHGMARLSPADVEEIRTSYAAGRATQPALGQRFGITQQAVSLIVTGKRWAAPPHA